MSESRLYRATDKERLLYRRAIRRSGCWEWTGSKTADGYGTIIVRGKVLRVHRLSYTVFVGEIPEGILVRHTCDNPSCFKPSHLCLGTDYDNVQDAISRGRKARGSRCNKSNLTEADVRNIRQDTRSLRAVAADYGVCHGTVGAIKRTQSWVEGSIN